MTSQHLKSRLAEAVDIIADCERYLAEIDYSVPDWDGTELYHRIVDFMDRHRDEMQSGSAC